MNNPVKTTSLVIAEFYTNGIYNSNVLETQRSNEMVHTLIIYQSPQRLLEQVASIDTKNVKRVETNLGDGQIRFS